MMPDEPQSPAQIRAFNEAVTREIVKAIRRGNVRVPYRNHMYYLLYLGDTKHGRRAHLEGQGVDFWIPAERVEPVLREIYGRYVREEQAARKKRDEQLKDPSAAGR
jgi:hypothetical protein